MENSEVQVKAIENVGEPEVQRPRRRGLIIGGVIGLVVLLAGAAFVGGQLLGKQVQPTGPGGSIVMAGGAGGEVAVSEVSIEIVSAKELPTTSPEVTALFAERKDNSIFVTEASGDSVVSVGDDGVVNMQTDGATQKIEVVVTNDTILYKDVTELAFDNLPADGKIQEKVAPGTLDEIGSGSFIRAWGERRGDRLLAKVLFFSPAMNIAAPGQAAP